MKRIAHKTAYHCAGWCLILIGLAGLVLPIIPGIVLLVIGLYFISLASVWLHGKVELVKIKYPKIGFHFEKFDNKVGKIFKKVH